MTRDLDAFCAGIADDFADAQAGLHTSPTALRRRGRQSASNFPSPITTMGWLRRDRRAFIYVSSPKVGSVKVGMSGAPAERCRSLGVGLFYAHEVPIDVARLVETEVLRVLGHRMGDGEWVRAKPERVAAVVRQVAARFRVEKAA